MWNLWADLTQMILYGIGLNLTVYAFGYVTGSWRITKMDG